MTGDEKYFIELKRDDLKKLAACTNITVGPGIRIVRTANALKFEIDEQQLKLWMWTFNKNGGFSASQADVAGVEINEVL